MPLSRRDVLQLAAIATLLPLALVPAMAQSSSGTGPDPALAFSAAKGEGDIARAWYFEPTTRYDHFVQGRDYEAAALAVHLASGETLSIDLPEDQVFEDTTPRLGDLDGDGHNEIVTILSSVDAGASIAVFEVSDGTLVLKTKTAFIGQAHRWLNIAGLGDFDGDGTLDIASVAMPHLVKRLDIHTLENGSLELLGSAPGFSNHRLGSTHTDMAVVADFDADGIDDLVLPNASRTALGMVRFAGRNFTVTATPPLPAPADGAMRVTGDGEIRIGLEDGSIGISAADAFVLSVTPGS